MECDFELQRSALELLCNGGSDEDDGIVDDEDADAPECRWSDATVGKRDNEPGRLIFV